VICPALSFSFKNEVADMPVVNNKSDLFPASSTTRANADAARARGELKVATFTVANASTDSANSTYLLASVPADALFDG
jgi:hypothetical protein